MVKIKPNVAVSESGFLFNPANGESYSLNPVGTRIFGFLKEGKSYEEIRDSFMREYTVDHDSFERDYDDFVNMLKQYNLTERDEEEV
ncbi:MAG: PqqD family protein [Bacteroidales bacterium]|nr:PqqD family protein [Bacteroidales bacterium]MCF8344897.1 PqqD family protein [Bacteroidales bacterium]MCF8350426.1 PqqD family protein [Bacteroidales bacterium]MCF8377677.1 PqqD family protein [Bacteroidales bacterium]MCF8401953.1 PqqD family protein [Bacteroidales bacterium]